MPWRLVWIGIVSVALEASAFAGGTSPAPPGSSSPVSTSPVTSSQSTSSTPASGAGTALRFRRTAEIPGTPELHALIDALSGMGRVESAAIGPAGMPSTVHATFRDLAAQIDRKQALELVFHQSPAIRAYMIDLVLSRFPSDAEALYPLLRDETSYATQSGCIVSSERLSERLASSLCQRPAVPQVQDLLARAVADPTLGRLRGRMLGCLAASSPDRARPLALAALEDKDREVHDAAVNALGVIARTDPELLRQLASHPTAPVRMAAAQAMAQSGRADSPAMIRLLVSDADPRVRAAAAAALGRSGVPDAFTSLQALMADSEKPVREAAIAALAELKTPEAVALVVAYVRQALKDEPQPGDEEYVPPFAADAGLPSLLLDRLEGYRSEAVTALMRDVLRESHSRHGRLTALQHVRIVRDRQSIPLVRRLMYDRSLYNMDGFIVGVLAELGDVGSIPRLETRLANAISMDAIQIGRALLTLGDPDLASHLQPALKRKDVQFDEPLRDVLFDAELDQ